MNSTRAIVAGVAIFMTALAPYRLASAQDIAEDKKSDGAAAAKHGVVFWESQIADAFTGNAVTTSRGDVIVAAQIMSTLPSGSTST